MRGEAAWLKKRFMSTGGSSSSAVSFANVKFQTCGGVFKSVFFPSFPIMADLRPTLASPLLLREGGRICARARVRACVCVCVRERERERERETHPVERGHNYNNLQINSALHFYKSNLL